jgi:hypothetical protein
LFKKYPALAEPYPILHLHQGIRNGKGIKGAYKNAERIKLNAKSLSTFSIKPIAFSTILFLRRFLFTSNGFTLALTGTAVGFSALTTYRQTFTMA